MKIITSEPKVVEQPAWVVAAQDALGKLPTHISSQEAEGRYKLMDVQWVEPENRPKYWVRTVFDRFKGATYKLPQEKFTCIDCPQPISTGAHYCQCCSNQTYVVSTKRCSSCNTRFMRWKRVKRAFKWLAQECERLDVQPKFLTITKTLRTSPTPFTEEMINKDRQIMLKEFRMTRKTQAWPTEYSGIWVYEAKVRAPGDEIRERWPDDDGNHPVIRTATEFELHGHIHCALATKWIDREPLLERHEGVHVKGSKVNHMRKYLLGYMLVDTVGRYNRIGG